MKLTPRSRLVASAAAVAGLVGGSFAAAELASASTEPVTAPLAAPVGLSPDDCLDKTVTPQRDTDAGCSASRPFPAMKNVMLDWAPVTGATGYRVQVGTDSTWSDDPVLTQDVLQSELTLPASLPHSTYVWRVAALKAGALGHWSSESTQDQPEAQFTRAWHDAPTPLAPAQGSTTTTDRSTFSWSPVLGASAYEVQVSTSRDFPRTANASPDTTPSPTADSQASPVTNYCYTARTRFTPFTEDVRNTDDAPGACVFTPFAAGTPLFWRVRPLDRFVDAAPDVETTPASTAGVSYLPPAQQPTDPDIAKECPGSASVTPSTAPSATASATAQAVAPSGADAVKGPDCAPTHPSELGTWSAVTSFTEQPAAQPVPACTAGLVCTTTLAQEPNGLCTVSNAGAVDAEKAVCRDFPTISWGAVAGATRYRVNIALDEQFSNIQRIVDTSGLSWTPNDSWRDSTAATSYYYAVQACTSSGCGAVTSTPPAFRKVTAPLTAGAKPGPTGEFALTWTTYAAALTTATSAATQDAYAYHVQIATADHASYDAVVDEVTVDASRYVPLKALPDGSYVWRVQAVDGSLHRLPWSTSQAFVRDTTPPTIASVTPASNVAVTQPLTVTFSEPVTGVSASTLTLVPASPASVRVVDATTAVLTPTTALKPGATYDVVTSSDIADLVGNAATGTGRSVSVNPLVDDGSKALAYAGTWRALNSSNAVGGTYHSGSAGGNASVVFVGTRVTVIGCLAPANGYLDVYVDGVRKTRVSTYRSYSGCGVTLAAVGGLARTSHTLKLVVVGAKPSASKGLAVGLDAVRVTR